MLYEVHIYPNQHQLNEPHFTLEVQESDSNDDDKLNPKVYQVSFSLLSTQDGYVRFYSKWVKAITTYNPNLDEWSSTLLFYTLTKYQELNYIDFEQDFVVDSPFNLRFAKPLAEVFAPYILEQQRMEKSLKEAQQGKVKLNTRQLGKHFSISVGKATFDTTDPNFVVWIMELIKQSLLNGSHPLDLGLNLSELAIALEDKSIEKLDAIVKAEPYGKIIKNSQFITLFCKGIHQLICALEDKNAGVIKIEQLELYSKLLELFNMPNSDDYLFQSQDKSKRKKVADRFRKLLHRSI